MIVEKAPRDTLQELAKALIDKKVHSSSEKWTILHPYHLAAEYGLVDSYQYLMEISRNKNPGTGKGQTPLHVAADRGQLEICRLILDIVEDKNPANLKEGATPLHLAATQGHLEVCKLFLDR